MSESAYTPARKGGLSPVAITELQGEMYEVPGTRVLPIVQGPPRKTHLTVEDLENPLLQCLSRLGSHEDVNDFQVGAGTE